MSESKRRVCGERLSSQLVDRDAGVVGKSVSNDPFAAVKIGSVGKRLKVKMDQMIRKHERKLPGALQRMSAYSTFQNMFRFGRPDLTYLLWQPDIEEEEIEEVAPPSPWMKTSPYVGAKTFRMPSSLGRAARPRRKSARTRMKIEQPQIEESTALPSFRSASPARARKDSVIAAKGFAPAQEHFEQEAMAQGSLMRPQRSQRTRARTTPLSRALRKVDKMNIERSAAVQALESLPPFLASSPAVQERVLRSVMRSSVAQRKNFSPKSLQEKYFAPRLQDELQEVSSAADQARYRLASQREARGLRPVGASSPMMQALSSYEAAPAVATKEPEATPSVWHTSSTPNRTSSTKATAIPATRARSQAPQQGAQRERMSSKRAILSNISRSLKNTVDVASKPSVRMAQQLSTEPSALQVSSPMIQALQRISLGSEQD